MPAKNHLSDGRREGNFRKVTKKYENLLLEVIEKNPEECGYEFGRWTSARLATYLELKKGIKLIDTLSKYLQR